MSTQTTTSAPDLTPTAPDARVRFHVTFVNKDEDGPRLLDGMFGYANRHVAEAEADLLNTDEIVRAANEGREVRELFYVTQSTMAFEVLPFHGEDAADQDGES